MKVVQVIPSLHGGGGAERSLASLGPYLCRSIDLHVVTFARPGGLRADLEAAGATVTELSPTTRLGVARALRSLLGDLQPDLVHTTLLEADLLGRVAAASLRLPLVSSLVNVHYGREHFDGGIERRAKTVAVWAADAASAQTVNRFHAITGHVADTMSRRLGIARGRIDVIPRGRDPDQLGVRSADRRRKVRDGLGLAEGPVVFAAARHERQKGLDVLLRAAAIVVRQRPEVRFVIGGRDGASSALLRRLTYDLQLTDHVQMIGQRDDVPDLMAAADVWCVPSLWEGFGGILIEAMALEVRVVASALPPIIEVAGSDACFDLVTPGDPGALAAALLGALRQDTDSVERAAAGRQRFLALYTSEQVAARMVHFYEATADGPRRLSRPPKR